MATATYTTKYDAANESWDVIDADGDVIDSHDTLADAVADADRRSDEDEVEALGNVLIDMVNDAINAGDLAALRRMYARLKA